MHSENVCALIRCCVNPVAQMEFGQLATFVPVTDSDLKLPTKHSRAEVAQGVKGDGRWNENGRSLRSDAQAHRQLSIELEWNAPFFSGGGYSSEAISYVAELSKWLPVGIGRSWRHVECRNKRLRRLKLHHVWRSCIACAKEMLTIICRRRIRYSNS